MGLFNDTVTREAILAQLQAIGFSHDAIRHLSTTALRIILSCHDTK
jgi:hypothetical protein